MLRQARGEAAQRGCGRWRVFAAATGRLARTARRVVVVVVFDLDDISLLLVHEVETHAEAACRSAMF